MPSHASLNRSRMIATSAIGLLALLLAAPGLVGAQSLADVARKEAERRKAVKTPGKVYTNSDAKKTTPLTVAAQQPQPAAG